MPWRQEGGAEDLTPWKNFVGSNVHIRVVFKFVSWWQCGVEREFGRLLAVQWQQATQGVTPLNDDPFLTERGLRSCNIQRPPLRRHAGYCHLLPLLLGVALREDRRRTVRLAGVHHWTETPCQVGQMRCPVP